MMVYSPNMRAGDMSLSDLCFLIHETIMASPERVEEFIATTILSSVHHACNYRRVRATEALCERLGLRLGDGAGQ
jgi:hypothetical protein